MDKLKPVAKALTAAVVAFCGAGATAATDGHISGAEWFAIVGATAGALALVWRVPNTTTDASP